MAKFSLAQSLSELRKERKSCDELFASAHSDLRNAVSRMIEHKLLILYYYMIAICCEAGGIGVDNSQIYTLKIYELLSELPNKERVRLFSPLIKVDMLFDEFANEVRAFEARNNGRALHQRA
jgi:hypothetical protein